MRAAIAVAFIASLAVADDWQKPDQVLGALALKRSDAVAVAEPGAFLAPLIASRVRALVNLDDAKIEEHSVDVIVLYDVLHSVDPRAPFYLKLRRVLRPGGRIVNIDFSSDPPSAAPSKPKLTEAQAVDEFKSAGFHIRQSIGSLPYRYVQVFE